VDRRERFQRFELDDHHTFDDQIRTIAAWNPNTAARAAGSPGRHLRRAPQA
jgi:hypothetical protein